MRTSCMRINYVNNKKAHLLLVGLKVWMLVNRLW